MLETHRIDLQIINAIESIGDGATIPEIHRRINETGADPLSIDAVKRHLPGLGRLCRVRGVQSFRDERLVTVWVTE
ncbi:hypothetical protein Enr13x_07000 [Stieleria neptunia]|uniref:Uncharacterized protein n=1 Tax=Stieleria neptunia TaxID=2527979 RepID=A0A518HJ34_9BACT|nr:hypothetical protein [Stieleria neptunia]QDV40864.1 hypothetical protein Enr13x_07000 [Stieleria neptunia]